MSDFASVGESTDVDATGEYPPGFVDNLAPPPEYEPPEISDGITKQTGRPKLNNGPCSVSGCDRPSKVKGLCANHYAKSRKGTLKAEAVQHEQLKLTDEMVGKACMGVTALSSLALGPHWRLMKHEERKLGEALGPIARMYPELFGKWMTLLVVGPTVVEIFAPRVMITVGKFQGKIPKGKEREMLMMTLAMVKAEEKFDDNSMEKEAEAFLRMQQQVGMQAVASMHANEKVEVSK